MELFKKVGEIVSRMPRYLIGLILEEDVNPPAQYFTPIPRIHASLIGLFLIPHLSASPPHGFHSGKLVGCRMLCQPYNPEPSSLQVNQHSVEEPYILDRSTPTISIYLVNIS